MDTLYDRETEHEQRMLGGRARCLYRLEQRHAPNLGNPLGRIGR